MGWGGAAVPSRFATSNPNPKVNLSRNRLRVLPDSLCSGPGAGALRSLIVDHNDLEALPDGLGCLTSLHRLSASFNALCALPASAAGLGKLRSVGLRNNPALGPAALVAALADGERATLRFILGLPESHSLAYQATWFEPVEKPTVRRLAGGRLAVDEAEVHEKEEEEGDGGGSEGSEGSSGEGGEGDKKGAKNTKETKPKKPASSKDEVLVYDHHGDLLDEVSETGGVSHVRTRGEGRGC